MSDMVFGETAVGRGNLTASKLRVTLGLPRGPSRPPAGRSPSMQQLPPCSIPPPAGVRMCRPAVGTGNLYLQVETFLRQELPPDWRPTRG